MSLCRSLFQKEIYELTTADLQSFFSSDQEETSVLEFKSGGATLEDIHKEVAAFLNTEGGILIIGAPQEIRDRDKKRPKTCSGPLTPATKISDQDSLMRSIASSISPSPVTVKAKTVFIEEGSVYILEIGQSTNPPHQVSATGIYYIRLERDSKAAPHGLVEALFFKRQKSDLRVAPVVSVKPSRKQVRLDFYFRNESLVHIDKHGWHLEIRGVQSSVETSADSLRAINDDNLERRGEIDTMLVKGMQTVVSFEFQLRFPVFYLKFSYYAKDHAVETIEMLYDCEGDKHVHMVDSKFPENNVAVCESIQSVYEKMLTDIIHRFLAKTYYYDSRNLYPATPDDIKALELELDIFVPRSLQLFWLLTNGFQGHFRNITFLLYSLDQFRTVNQDKKYGGNTKDIRIGAINGREISLHYRKGIAFFGWFDLETNYKDSYTTSFFDLIEGILALVKH